MRNLKHEMLITTIQDEMVEVCADVHVCMQIRMCVCVCGIFMCAWDICVCVCVHVCCDITEGIFLA